MRPPAGVLLVAVRAEGRRLAVFFAKTYARVVTPSLAELDPVLPAEIAARSPLARSWRSFEHALDLRVRDARPHCLRR